MVQYTETTESAEVVPSELHPYVYHFLLENNLTKTAKSFRKETRTQPTKPDGPSLLDIYQKYKNEPNGKDETKSSFAAIPFVYDESEKAENVSEEKKKKKKKRKNSENIDFNIVSEVEPKPKKKKKTEVGAESDLSGLPSSVTVSDPAEETHLKKKKKKVKSDTPKVETNAPEVNVVPEEKINGSQEHPDVNDDVTDKKKKKKKGKKEKLANGPDEERRDTQIQCATTEEKSSSQEKNAVGEINCSQQKDALDETNSSQQEDEIESTAVSSAISSSKKLKKSESFRRVKEEEITVRDDLRDNSFEAKIGAQGDWGEKANKDLKFTKGKSFRHEKTKKKRGSYRGGNINTSVNSIRFEDDDD